MYYGLWLELVVLSLIASLAAFLWGLRSGQFLDQERARFLALESDLLSRPALEAPRRRRSAQAAALWVVLFMGFGAFLVALVMSILLR